MESQAQNTTEWERIMAKLWYGIEGLEFHFNGPWADPEITYHGVRDSSNVIVEDTMWERYAEDGGTDPHDGFEDYMRENAEEVYMLIETAREGA